MLNKLNILSGSYKVFKPNKNIGYMKERKVRQGTKLEMEKSRKMKTNENINHQIVSKEN